jgi:hypothetical protein
VRIPEWFDHQNMGHTISFWFRNKLPSMALCFSTKSAAAMPTGKKFFITMPILIIIGNKYDRLYMHFFIMSTHHTYLYDINLRQLDQHHFMKDSIHLENDWNLAEIICEHQEVHWNMEPLTEIGIHFFKQQNNMDDVQFTNPYEKIKLNNDDGGDFFYDVDDVLDDDVFYDVIDVLDDDDKDVLGYEDDHHSQ